LDVLKKAGEVRSWKGQWPVRLEVNGVLVCKMVPDFRVEWADGRTEFVEVKGMETAMWRLKRKLLMALHPGAAYRVVKAREALAL
jgi:hypothetical protein